MTIFYTPETASTVALVISLLYLHYQNRAERIVSDNRWAALKTESDDCWASMQKEWHETQKEIVTINRELLKISQRAERLETNFMTKGHQT